jgi:hypothetical protein
LSKTLQNKSTSEFYAAFYNYVGLKISRKYDLIPLLIDVAQGAVKEKVIRVIVATFRVACLVFDTAFPPIFDEYCRIL